MEDITKFLDEKGIDYDIFSVNMDDAYKGVVYDFVMKIEKAHERAGNSKLVFRCA